MHVISCVPAWGWLLISALFVGAGDFLAKKFGMHPTAGAAVIAVAVYSVGTITWLPVLLKHNELARMGMIWYVLTMIATVVIGVGVFHEALLVRHWAGIVLAVAGLVLLST